MKKSHSIQYKHEYSSYDELCVDVADLDKICYSGSSCSDILSEDEGFFKNYMSLDKNSLKNKNYKQINSFINDFGGVKHHCSILHDITGV